MLRAFTSLALIAVVVAWGAAPCLACVGMEGSANASQMLCADMDGGQPGPAAVICCAMDDSGRHTLPEATAPTPSTSGLVILGGQSLQPFEHASRTFSSRVGTQAKLDLSPFPTLHVPLRI